MSKFWELKNKNCSTVRLFALPDADAISAHQKQYFQWVEALLLIDGNHIVVNFNILRVYKRRKYVRIFVYKRII